MNNTSSKTNSPSAKDTAVITVVGKDKVGIIAAVSTALANENLNILDISQTILQDVFTMIMIVRIPESMNDFSSLKNRFDMLGQNLGVSIMIQHSDVFNTMHRI